MIFVRQPEGMALQPLSVYSANLAFKALLSEGAMTSPMFGFKLAPLGSEFSWRYNAAFGGTLTGYPCALWLGCVSDAVLHLNWQPSFDGITITWKKSPWKWLERPTLILIWRQHYSYHWLSRSHQAFLWAASLIFIYVEGKEIKISLIHLTSGPISPRIQMKDWYVGLS